jgi:hypothetical protein
LNDPQPVGARLAREGILSVEKNFPPAFPAPPISSFSSVSHSKHLPQAKLFQKFILRANY